MDHAQQVNEPNGQDPLSHKTLILLYPINVFTIKIEDTKYKPNPQGILIEVRSL